MFTMSSPACPDWTRRAHAASDDPRFPNAGVKEEDFDTVFYPGGHGPMWDLVEDKHSIKLIEPFVAAGKPIGIVCHSTGALHRVKTADGRFLVEGKEVTGFTKGEEEDGCGVLRPSHAKEPPLFVKQRLPLDHLVREVPAPPPRCSGRDASVPLISNNRGWAHRR
jgi:hypothetical protein